MDILLGVVFPDFDGAVICERCGDNDVLKRMAIDSDGCIRVSFERLNNDLGLEVPNVDAIVFRARNNPLAVRD